MTVKEFNPTTNTWYGEPMTTHDKDKIIAAAEKADTGFGSHTLGGSIVGFEAVKRFYAIAFEDGRQAEREECVVIAQTPVAGEQDDITMEAKDRIANAIRARGDRNEYESLENRAIV